MTARPQCWCRPTATGSRGTGWSRTAASSSSASAVPTGDCRPAVTDFARLSRQQWEGRPDLEAAFLDGYGGDPREAGAWRRALLREAVGTACWAYSVGDEPLEQQGYRMVEQALAMVP